MLWIPYWIIYAGAVWKCNSCGNFFKTWHTRKLCILWNEVLFALMLYMLYRWKWQFLWRLDWADYRAITQHTRDDIAGENLCFCNDCDKCFWYCRLMNSITDTYNGKSCGKGCFYRKIACFVYWIAAWTWRRQTYAEKIWLHNVYFSLCDDTHNSLRTSSEQ